MWLKQKYQRCKELIEVACIIIVSAIAIVGLVITGDEIPSGYDDY